MPYKIEMERRARASRLLEMATGRAAEHHAESQKRITAVVEKVRCLFEDQSFAEVLKSEKVESIPLIVLTDDVSAYIDKRGQDELKDRFGENCISFVVAWSFLYPLFGNAVIVKYLDDNWPGIIGEIKDAFISSIVSGPFPKKILA